ncbi:MAG: hypothetical protein KAG53_06375 [Endozoicomonadaceae bacterium]|nr:hypothetical protein [Endozoicomonadaceae bacterium]
MFGRVIAADIGIQYIKSSNPNAKLVESFRLALKSRNIEHTENETVAIIDNSQFNSSNDPTTEIDKIAELNKKICAKCSALMSEIDKIRCEISDKDNNISHYNNEIKRFKLDIDNTNKEIQALETNCYYLQCDINSKTEEEKDLIRRLRKMHDKFDGINANTEAVFSLMKSEFSNFYHNEWQKLYNEIHQKNKQTSNNTEGANEDAKMTHCLLNMFESARVEAENIILNTQLNFLSNDQNFTDNTETGLLWKNNISTLGDDLMNNKGHFVSIFNKAIDDIIKNSEHKDAGYENLKPYLFKVLKIRLLMFLQPSPMVFSRVDKNAIFNEDEYVRFDENKSNENNIFDSVILPAILIKKNGQVVAKGLAV